MAMTEATKKALIMSGYSAERIAQMEGDYTTAREAHRDRKGPEGRQAGRVFVAANPLEHLGHGLQQWAGQRKLKKQEAKVEGARENLAAGRKGFSKFLASKPGENVREPGEGWIDYHKRVGTTQAQGDAARAAPPPTYQTKVDHLRQRQQELMVGVGHPDKYIADQAQAGLDQTENSIDRIYSEEKERISNDWKQKNFDLKEDMQEETIQYRKDKIAEEIRHNKETEITDLAKVKAIARGNRIDLTAGERGEITSQRHRLAGIMDSQIKFKDEYTQRLKGKLPFDVNIPYAGELMNTLASKGFPGLSDEDDLAAANFFARWSSQFTLETRNEMFGATLTPSEAAAWKSSLELDPDSDPAYIRAIMADLERVTKTRMRHQAEVLLAGGNVDEEYVNDLYGPDWRNWGLMSAEDKKVYDSMVPTSDDLSEYGDTEQTKQRTMKNAEKASNGEEAPTTTETKGPTTTETTGPGKMTYTQLQEDKNKTGNKRRSFRDFKERRR